MSNNTGQIGHVRPGRCNRCYLLACTEKFCETRDFYRRHLLEGLDNAAFDEVTVPLLDAPVDFTIQPACSSHRQAAILQ